tara:strand:- start:10194 stop:10766 length:573 start_codon:yes stop_codon:yes gene_type:complete
MEYNTLEKKKESLAGKIVNDFVFIHIPKTGGRSITQNCFHNQFCMYADWYKYRGYNKFITQVRNPYDRWESMYWHLKRHKEFDYDFNNWTLKTIIVQSQGIVNMNKVFNKANKYQLKSLCQIMGKPMWFWIDREVEVHKLEEGTIWKRLGIEERKLNVGNNRKEVIWSDEAKSVFTKYFERDFKQFGYDI